MQAILDSLRRAGWTVVGHYDDVVKKRFSTYWKMQKGSRIVAGEGETDAEALSSIRSRIGMGPDERLADAGPWVAGRCGPRRGDDDADDRVYLQSEDFTHDVRLYVDGDFAGVEDRLAYAEALAARMNGMPVPDLTPRRKQEDAS